MAIAAPVVPLDPAPRRPDAPLGDPAPTLAIEVDIDHVLLANPTLAVSRLLMSEAGAHVLVEGDETRMVISLALPHDDHATRCAAEQWVRWCLHNAGVRGQVRTVDQSPR